MHPKNEDGEPWDDWYHKGYAPRVLRWRNRRTKITGAEYLKQQKEECSMDNRAFGTLLRDEAQRRLGKGPTLVEAAQAAERLTELARLHEQKAESVRLEKYEEAQKLQDRIKALEAEEAKKKAEEAKRAEDAKKRAVDAARRAERRKKAEAAKKAERQKKNT